MEHQTVHCIINCFRSLRRASGANFRHLNHLPSQTLVDCLKARTAYEQSQKPLHHCWKSKRKCNRKSLEDQKMLTTFSITDNGVRQVCVITSLLIHCTMANSLYDTQHATVVARNVLGITHTGAQTNVWLLRNFLAAGFNCSILIPASDLDAANHSDIEIEGTFFAVVKPTCNAMS